MTGYEYLTATGGIMSSDVNDMEHQASLWDHLSELRTRLVRSTIYVIGGFVVCYAFVEQIFAVLALPLTEVLPPGTTLIFKSYPAAFFTYLKLALVSGLFLVSPLVLYQIWAFIAPGLYEHEKRLAMPFVILSTLFFTGGAFFGYMFVFPAAFRFLAGYAGARLELLPDVGEYFSLTIKLLLGFGFAFELPVFMVFLGLLGIVSTDMLKKNRKYAILVVFILAAILTPTPDVINQVLMAGPLLVLYEISIVALRLIKPEKPPEETGEVDD
jgi:sec-independent protein translocase protein TatC